MSNLLKNYKYAIIKIPGKPEIKRRDSVMKRFLEAILKVLVALCGVALIFGIVWLINGGSIYVMRVIQLYWNTAKENIVESIIFYSMFAIALFIIDMIIHVKNKKKKEE